MKYSFEDFLKEKHAEGYSGTDDNMPGSFNNWLLSMDGEEYLQYAQEWGNQIAAKTRVKIADWLSDAQIQFPQLNGNEAIFDAFVRAANYIRNTPV